MSMPPRPACGHHYCEVIKLGGEGVAMSLAGVRLNLLEIVQDSFDRKARDLAVRALAALDELQREEIPFMTRVVNEAQGNEEFKTAAARALSRLETK